MITIERKLDGIWYIYKNGIEISKGAVLSKVMLKASKYFKGQGL